jgi:hypothetical protein
MMLNVGSETALVCGLRLFRIRVAASDPPRSVRVSIKSGRRPEVNFDQPGWRQIGVGVGVSGSYLWSARAVISLPNDADSDPVVDIVVDEDLLAVFEVSGGWILVCETSVRRVIDGRETGRLEFGDVVETCVWVSDNELELGLDDGSEQRVSLRDTGLLDI